MKSYSTIRDVVKRNLCTGCGTCVGLCPRSAIELIKNGSRGIYLPRIKKEQCNRCGICIDVCPGHAVDFKVLNPDIFGKQPEDTFLGNYLDCYVGYSTDYDIRYNSSSGGLVTALLIHALESGMIDGALVTRMKKDNPLEPEPFIAKTRDEVISASGSKYCPVPANIALRNILHTQGKYAVVGLPCHLHGLRKAEMTNRLLRERIKLHLGIFCGREISSLGTEFLLRRIQVAKAKVKKLDYRGMGWPGSMVIELKDKVIPLALSEYYGSMFSSLVPWRCMLCIDASAEFADISFGDAWLPEIKDKDTVGTSIIVSRNARGQDAIQWLMREGKAKLETISGDKVKESQGGFRWKRVDIWARFEMSKLLGRELPIYGNDVPNPSSFYAYLSTSLLYLKRYLAFRTRLIWLFDILDILMRFASRVKSRLNLVH